MATSYATLGAGSTFGGNIFSKDGYITLGANVDEVAGVSSRFLMWPLTRTSS